MVDHICRRNLSSLKWRTGASLRLSIVDNPMTVGRVLDARASDPELKERSPKVTTRLGNQELALLLELAETHGMTRSSLARRLLVKGLLELLEERAPWRRNKKSGKASHSDPA